MTDTVKNPAIVKLYEKDPGLRKMRVAIGWSAPEQSGGHDLDLDASLFLLTRENRVRFDEDFIFYNNLSSTDGSIVHAGDDRNGRSEGDDELIEIDLNALPYDVEKLVFVISIHNARERYQSFKDVESDYIRLLNAETGKEIARFDMVNDTSENIAYQLAALIRRQEGWEFERLQMPHEEGLYGIARDFGVHVAEM